MIQKNHFLHFLFCPSLAGLIIILLLLFNVLATAQESTPQEFILGVPFTGIPDRRTESIYYDTFYTSGMNSLFQYAVNGPNGNKNLMEGYNVFAYNQDSLDWPGYYANCYYTKWEAEQDQNDPLRVGVKHAGGTSAWWNDTLCWSSGIFVERPDELLIYGPHYRQDNRYKSWAHGDRYDVRYYVRYNMALDNPHNEDPNRLVCKIKVVYKYRKYDSANHWGDSVCVFREKTLKVGDFPQGGYFKYFSFDPPSDYYKYPPQFQLPDFANKIDPSINEYNNYPLYEDSRQGIQFVVDWLVNDPAESGLTLYVDKIEVYDRDWKDYYLADPVYAESLIVNYATGFSEWSNLKYFLGMDEPWSIDAFSPLRIVDSLLYNNPYYAYKHRLLTVFNPYWSWDNKINGDTLLFQFYRMANPEQLIVDMYPFSPTFPIARAADFEYLRYTFQECHTLQPGFWYMGQGFGEQTLPDSAWWVWRYPTNEEFKASMMLALAHGAKGLLPWIYDSYTYWAYNISPPERHYIKGLREEDDNITATPIWNLLKNNIVPRLKGKLGKTLMHLDYTGEYENIYYKIPSDDPLPQPLTHEYLAVGCGSLPADDMYWHFGFFNRPNYPEDKYFFTTNLMKWRDSLR
jgi:hypothetical protein